MNNIGSRPLDADVRLRDALLMGFTFATGIVDAVSFLGLGSIFTANMTGNTVFLALAIGQRNPLSGARSADALVGFAVGAIVAGRLLGRIKEPGTWPRRVSWVFGGEFALLILFNAGWVLTEGQPAEFRSTRSLHWARSRWACRARAHVSLRFRGFPRTS